MLLASFLPTLSAKATLALYFCHALLWCLFHSFGLGLLLKAQSEKKFLVRHFLTHYHYPRNDNGKGALTEAFSNWKSIYNMSTCMTYGKLHFHFELQDKRLRYQHRSFFPRRGMENIFHSKQLDCGQRVITAYIGRRMFPCALYRSGVELNYPI